MRQKYYLEYEECVKEMNATITPVYAKTVVHTLRSLRLPSLSPILPSVSTSTKVGTGYSCVFRDCTLEVLELVTLQKYWKRSEN